MARPWARSDDLRAGDSLLRPPPSLVLTAVRPDEVAAVLPQVRDATGRVLPVGPESVHRRPGVVVVTSPVGGS
jgi:hypothetical protein